VNRGDRHGRASDWDGIPDHSSIWRFREAFGTGLAEKLFAEITRQIDAKGFVLKQGTLIDASLIPSAVNAPDKPEEPLPPGPDGKPQSKLVRSELDKDAAWTRKGKTLGRGQRL
jgi:IS5 family transposase